MKSEILTGLMSLITAAAGMVGVPLEDGTNHHESNHAHPNSKHAHDNNHDDRSGNFTLGSAHEHALFFLNVNGTEVNFTHPQYQVRSSYVHLENFKPHIVHKHTENVTWGYFLDTINVEANRSSGCISFKGREKCGNLSMVLNGEEADLGKEIEQGDNLALMLNSTDTERYMSEELPEDYQNDAQGRGV